MLKRVLKKLRRRAKKIVGRRARLQARIASLEAKVDGLCVHVPTLLNLVPSLKAAIHRIALNERETSGDGLAPHLPTLLNLPSSVRALGHEHRTLDEAVGRLRGRLDEVGAALADQVPREIARLRGELAGTLVASDRHEALEGEFRRYAATQDGTLRYLTNRVEFVRRELLYELRYGAGARPQPGLAAEARVVDREKIERLRAEGLRLNVGCGHIPLDGYANVDRRELPGVDIVAEADAIPLDKGSVRELASAHLIEHFPLEEFRRKILPHWRDLLAEGGVLRAISPDADAMTRGMTDGSYPFDDFRDVLFGAQDYDGDFHFNIFTPDSCARLLEEEGFADARIVERGRPNGRCFEFEIVAVKARVAAPSAAPAAQGAPA